MKGEPKAVKAKLAQLLRSPMVPFPPAGERLDVPDLHGVYIIYDPKGQGSPCRPDGSRETRALPEAQQPPQGASSFVVTALDGKGSVLRDGYKYRRISIENSRLRAFLEAFAIGHLCPDHIGDGAVLLG
jgi:hypothetical protein